MDYKPKEEERRFGDRLGFLELTAITLASAYFELAHLYLGLPTPLEYFTQ